MASLIFQHELLERGVTVLPGPRTVTEKRCEIVEIGVRDLDTDLIFALQVAGQTKGNA